MHFPAPDIGPDIHSLPHNLISRQLSGRLRNFWADASNFSAPPRANRQREPLTPVICWVSPRKGGTGWVYATAETASDSIAGSPVS